MEQGQAQHGQGRDQGKYWAAAQKRGWIWEHPGLTRANIGQELDRFAARHGLAFAPGVKKTLAESLPLATVALRGELEKILLLAGDAKTIQPEHLGPSTPWTPSTSSPSCAPCRAPRAGARPGTAS
ncbi:hypothetical protein MASR1M66_21460 [Aminivibrio sp.]